MLKKHTYYTPSRNTLYKYTLLSYNSKCWYTINPQRWACSCSAGQRKHWVTYTSPASLFLSLQYVLTKNQTSACQGKEKQRHTSLRRACASIREECHRLKLTQTFCVSKPRLFWNNRSSSLKQHSPLEFSASLSKNLSAGNQTIHLTHSI